MLSDKAIDEIVSIIKAKLTAAERKDLQDSDFAVPDKRELPIHDAEHVRLAWDMVDKTKDLTAEEKAEAKKRILARAKELGIDTSDWKTDEVKKAAIFVPFEKADEELGVIFGTINKADVEDADGHTIPAKELERALYDYVAKCRVVKDTHGDELPGDIVAAWMFPDGSAKIGFRPSDPEVFEKAKRGEYVGFSIGGFGQLVD
ncbi:hypothetical protein GCM10025857_14940 [Alicyclobacillus contaminans]|uniref:DUF6582 domain-containing protein n=1 Tax=Alicyclobacillus contaminans TaxID=392016 RepID=UPI000406B6AE|nr:XkdF-like putative serine protease domain-containing protein [Alicyclobacillus contaminans]GMA50137.1 hypothetical protein GCM10025857_14940 [Alicyclobacillus contaminans]